MSLHLSSRELADLQAATEVLLSPLEHMEVGTWARSALESSKRLFRADRSMLTLPLPEGPYFLSPDLDAGLVEQFRALFVESVREPLQSIDAVVQSGIEARRANNLKVWTNLLLAELAGLELHETPYYRELLRPAGVEYGFGVTARLGAGEAWLSLACMARDPDWLGEERTRGMLSLIYPAFRAGVRLLSMLQMHRSTLAATVDSLSVAMALFDLRGRELHRNATFEALLSEEPDAELLLSGVLSLAGSLCRSRTLPRKSSPTMPTRRADREVTTRFAAYRLQGGHLPSGCVLPGPAVLVLLQRLSPLLLPASRLREQFGLTPAECRLIPGLTTGLTNKRLAQSLGTSPHTVRNQLQGIFRKLGVRSRAGVLSRVSIPVDFKAGVDAEGEGHRE